MTYETEKDTQLKRCKKLLIEMAKDKTVKMSFAFARDDVKKGQNGALVFTQAKNKSANPKTIKSFLQGIIADDPKKSSKYGAIAFGYFFVDAEAKRVVFLPENNASGLGQQLNKFFSANMKTFSGYKPLVTGDDGAAGAEDGAEQEPEAAHPLALKWQAMKAKVEVPYGQFLTKAEAQKVDMVQKIWQLSHKKAKEANYPVAMEALKKLVAVMDEGRAPKDQPRPEPIKIWREAKEAADISVSNLQATLRGYDNPDLQRIASQGLTGVTNGTQTALMAALLDYERAEGEEARGAAKKKVQAQIQAFDAFLKSDRIVQLCEKNPFGADVQIVAPLRGALQKINASLTV